MIRIFVLARYYCLLFGRIFYQPVTVLLMAGFITGCADQLGDPRMVSSGGDSPPGTKDKGSTTTTMPAAQFLAMWQPRASGSLPPAPVQSPASTAGSPGKLPSSEPNYVIVEEGRSLNGIAYSHHVMPAALAAANHLTPPYKLKAGSRLVLPDPKPTPLQQVKASSAPPPIPVPPPTVASSLPSVAAMAPGKMPPLTQAAAVTILPDGPSNEIVAPQPPQQALTVPPPVSGLPKAPPVLPPRNPTAALPLPGE